MPKPKVKNFGKRIVVTLFVLMIFATATYYIKEKFFKPGFVHYKEFGIDIPTNYSIHGIDVSHYQQDIDWDLVKAMKVKNIAVGFVFVKATEGISIVDARFRTNMAEAKEAGLVRGAYHFFIGSRSGKAQAAHFIEHVNLKKGDLPPVLDVEQVNGANALDFTTRIKDWLTIVEKKYNTKPIIYCNIDFYKNYLQEQFSDYPLWIAHYLVKNKPRINNKWEFWQHNELGRVTGIRTYVDFNAFSGDSAEFKKLLIK
jgi:lysozyme